MQPYKVGGRGGGLVQRLKDGDTCAKRNFFVPEASKPSPLPGPPPDPKAAPHR